MVLGLRPEKIGAGPGAVTFDVVPRLVESLGSEMYVYVDVPPENRVGTARRGHTGDDFSRGDSLVARLPSMDGRLPRGSLTLSFDPARLHVFDARTQVAIA